ncbi:MAG: D-alanyl-D-alanine carboxypeptidase family protein [Eubacterium sp.]
MNKRLKCCFIILVLVLNMVFSKQGFGEETKELKESELSAKSAVLIDGKTGRVLFGKNYNNKMAMASTTKIMTCIVALENASPDEVVEISKRAASMPKVHMNAIKGEKYKIGDLLYAMMLESYNDVAVAVAEGVAGSVEEFAKLMNKKAGEIGAVNTNFVTPNGLDAKGHFSTAYDMALIGAYAIKNQQFLKITNTKSYSFYDCSNKRHIVVNNKDAFLNMSSDAIGIKTGFTGDAGYCFVGAVKSNNRVYVSCVLASGWPPNKTYKWRDTTKLMDYGKNNFDTKKILKNRISFPVNIENGTKKQIIAVAIGPYKALVSRNDTVEAKTEFNYELPIKSGEKIGEVKLYINNQCVKKCKIEAVDGVEKYDFKYCFKKTLDYFIFQ